MSPDTFRQWTDSYIEHKAPRRAARTVRDIKHRADAWLRFAADLPLSSDGVESFRRRAARELSNAYIESIISNVTRIAKFNGHDVHRGEPLPKPRPAPNVPTIQDVNAIYRQAGVTKWPRSLAPNVRVDWWRAWLAVVCWTALRIDDLRTLRWDQITVDSIKIRASKTSKSLEVPMTPWLRSHLDTIRHLYPERVFGIPTQLKQLRRELTRMEQSAGTDHYTPHDFRRFGIQQWTAADSVCGQLIHGKSIGVMDHYLDTKRLLESSARSVEIPPCFLSDQEKYDAWKAERELLDALRSVDPARRQTLLDVARSLSERRSR